MATKESEFYLQRLAQAEALEGAGINPFPADPLRPRYTNEQLLDSFSSLQGQRVDSVGRVVRKQDLGKISFMGLDDSTAVLQAVVKVQNLKSPPFKTYTRYFSEGDFVGATGFLDRTTTGEVSVFAEEVSMQAKALRALPYRRDVQDPEVQQRQRYLDTLINPESRERFRTRSRIVQGMRQHLINTVGALEVETPILDTTFGGAQATPFETYHRALGTNLYLRIANELYLKRMTIGGYYEGVFEFSRDFRNEGMDRTHNPEFTQVELYKPFWDYNDMMKMTEGMMADITKSIRGTTTLLYQGKEIDVKAPWRRLSIYDGLREKLGIDPKEITDDRVRAIAAAHNITGFTRGDILLKLFEELWENELIQPTFVIDFPDDTSALAKRHRTDPTLAERFEVFVGGMEVGNCYTELNDPRDQRKRFEVERSKRQKGDKETMPFDEDFILAQEYGMPPQAGIGISIDRWTMLLTDTDHIRQVIYFPTLKPKE